MKERPTSWVGEYVSWLGESLGSKDRSKFEDLNQFPSTLIWPIVQAHNSPGTVSPEEFHQVLMEGSKSPASGIMMFSAESIAQEPAKIEVLKKFYRHKN